MTEFKAGQRVKVEYEGTVRRAGDNSLTILSDDGKYRLVNANKARVTIMDPPNWPPRVGDIWEAEGREYFTRGHSLRDDIIIEPFDMGNPGPKWQYADEFLDDFKALNPTLVRRRGQ